MGDSGTVEVPHTAANLLRSFIRPQVLRICRNCSTHWKVPRYFARRHAGGLTESGARAANDVDLCDTYCQCPGCGTKHEYHQKHMWFVGRDLNLDQSE